MTPQYQTINTGEQGDCERACIASVLNLPIESVPFFADGENWDDIDGFLAPFGMYAMYLDWEPSIGAVKGYNVVYLRVPEQELTHAVVAYGDEIVHDPSGYNAPTDDPVSRMIFINMLD